MPEVETIRRYLQRSSIIGQKVQSVSIFFDKIISGCPAFLAENWLKGQQLKEVKRKGKLLILKFEERTVLVHLRMTGQFKVSHSEISKNKHEHVRIKFKNGLALCYEDQRKFGRLYFLENPEIKLTEIGIEPLTDEFTIPKFIAALKGKNREIKAVLLDQSCIAGLGNIYVDESLWHAKIHPKTLAANLTTKAIEVLYQSIQEVIAHAIELKGTSLGTHSSNYHSPDGTTGEHQLQLKIFRKQGQPCPRCETPILKIRCAQRGTHFCPRCQVTS